MAGTKDDLGKGPSRPSDMPGAKRPYATIDVKATELAGAHEARAGAGSPTPGPSLAGAESKATTAILSRARAALGLARIALAERRRWAQLATSLAAGSAGALLMLLFLRVLAAPEAPPRQPELGELRRRVGDIESALGLGQGGTGLAQRVEELSRGLGAVGQAQSSLAREASELSQRIGESARPAPELEARIARLEQSLAERSGSAQPGPASSRLAELEKSTREASAWVSASRTELARLAERLEALKAQTEERLNGAARGADLAPLASKVGTLEREVEGVLRSEADRARNTSRLVLGLELANLKRTVDRGEGYAAQLAQLQRMAGDTLNLKALERSMHEGVPTVQALTKSFQGAANAMLDAEREKPEATLIERLLSGAGSIVRVRKAGHDAADTSVEAVVARMDAALKEGRLNDALAQAKALPPKAQRAGEDWIKQATARAAVDQAMADIEAALKTSLAGRAGNAEPR